MNGLAWVGPVKVDWHSQPSMSWDPPKSDGLRIVKISGEYEWPTAEQLSELDANEGASVTIGGHHGVLVPIWMSNAPELNFTVGWYILESFPLGATVDQSATGLPVGTITAAFLGQAPELVIARGAVPKGNDFGLTARSLVVSPFRPEDDAGDRFLVDPGGSFATREYDPTYPHDTAALTPAESASIGFYTGTVTDSTDELETVCFPRLAWSKDAPRWLTQQGGNVRAYDRRAGREVYGPHPFLETTDLLVTNGLVRFWVGNRRLPPFLNVEAFAQSSWEEQGYLHLADPGGTGALRGARLVYITPERVDVALSIQDQGDVFVSLCRGERGLRLSNARYARWSGLPPWGRVRATAQGDGKFGKGIDASASYFRLRVPASL